MYTIMSMNSLQIAQRGGIFTPKTTKLFFVSYNPNAKPTEPQVTWSPFLTDAKMFGTEDEAWNEALDIWGFGFPKDNFVVASVHPRMMERSERFKESLNT